MALQKCEEVEPCVCCQDFQVIVLDFEIKSLVNLVLMTWSKDEQHWIILVLLKLM